MGEAEKAVPTGKITGAVSEAANIVTELVSTGLIYIRFAQIATIGKACGCLFSINDSSADDGRDRRARKMPIIERRIFRL